MTPLRNADGILVAPIVSNRIALATQARRNPTANLSAPGSGNKQQNAVTNGSARQGDSCSPAGVPLAWQYLGR
eukprot:scaffold7207_cov520-Prasinococcus_capsulatus_cf.AAC.8